MNELIKRVTKNGFIFLNSERTYKSKGYKTREDREIAIEKYLVEEEITRKEYELKRKTEYDLVRNFN